MKILVTGSAGFIGHKVAIDFAQSGNEVIGVDYLCNGHATLWQKGRLEASGITLMGSESGVDKIYSKTIPDLSLSIVNIENRKKLERLFAQESFDVVIHLAARAGVRNSIKAPYSYFKSNIEGFVNIIEACRKHKVRYLFFASSSSVYGKSKKLPLEESRCIGDFESYYALTKAANEMIAKYYAKSYGLCCIGMRFFSVYGPWGRPDMAPMIFANALYKGMPIRLYDKGEMSRDFTYIDDVTRAINFVVTKTVKYENLNLDGYYDVFNIGTGKSIKIKAFVSILEKLMCVNTSKRSYPAQKGDVDKTKASICKLKEYASYTCDCTIESGLSVFVKWFYQHKEDIVKKVIADKFHLGVNSIDMDNSFVRDFRADSLDLLDLVIRIEKHTGKKIPNEKIREISTVGDLLKSLEINL